MKDSPLSPIDDRYYEEVRELTPFFSQESLVQERARIELEYLSFLMRVGVAPSSKIPAIEVSYEEVKGLEADLGHDVKALEVHLVNRLRASGREELAPFVHLGLTCEDVNNLAYARLLSKALKSVMVPACERLAVGLGRGWQKTSPATERSWRRRSSCCCEWMGMRRATRMSGKRLKTGRFRFRRSTWRG